MKRNKTKTPAAGFRRAAGAAGLAAVVGLALGQTSSGAPIDPPAAAPTITGGVVTQASTDQVAAFGILGTSRAGEDVVTADAATERWLEQQLRDKARGNLHLAHRIGAPDSAGRAWIVPGDGQLCTVTERLDTGLAGFGCVPTAIAAAGRALGIREGGPKLKDGMAVVDLLVPDGVGVITIGSSQEPSETEAVVNRNWIQKRIKHPTSISFDLRGTRRTHALGQPPSM